MEVGLSTIRLNIISKYRINIHKLTRYNVYKLLGGVFIAVKHNRNMGKRV